MSATISTALCILVVDDNRDAANTTARLLSLWGHNVHTAFDGRSGVREACLLRPDLILMDIGLPLLDGFEAARQVRSALGRTATMVALTAYSSDIARAEGREAGFNYYLVKPAWPVALQEILSEVAKNKNGDGAPSDND
jgi:CheY-like chemotaxis protein